MLEEERANARIISGDPRLSIAGSFASGFAVNVALEPPPLVVTPPTSGDCHVFTINCGTGPGKRNFGAWFWPTYNRSVTPPSGFTIYYFRHYCLRGIVVDYDQDAHSVSVVQAYRMPFQTDNPCSGGVGDYLLGNPVDDWYFVPSAAALDELIAAAAFDDPPPSTGTIRLTIYMEMHREYVNVWEVATGGGKHFNNGYSSANLVGDETTSVPAVMKVCWQSI